MRDSHAQILTVTDELGVLSVRQYAVTGGDFDHALADFDHAAEVGLAERDRRGELRPDSYDRRQQPLGLHFVEHHTNLFRLLTGFFQVC